ncbi:hypothetical protein CDAR_541851 [Caerostris darwini]|uniref:Uncharacterized protein n=1 Tax=Caerostris darwini TaxID=1538125 RepID=A0AAV4UVI2_9ARAC|nr:hypothetical protein CDAR_541851 [Caerostris darwini]
MLPFWCLAIVCPPLQLVYLQEEIDAGLGFKKFGYYLGHALMVCLINLLAKYLVNLEISDNPFTSYGLFPATNMADFKSSSLMNSLKLSSEHQETQQPIHEEQTVPQIQRTKPHSPSLAVATCATIILSFPYE